MQSRSCPGAERLARRNVVNTQGGRSGRGWDRDTSINTARGARQVERILAGGKLKPSKLLGLLGKVVALQLGGLEQLSPNADWLFGKRMRKT